MGNPWRVSLIVLLAATVFAAQENHQHGKPEQLGKVSFAVSCSSAVQAEFDRGVALLHSFAYSEAVVAFQRVAEHDPKCSMAHWGMAMTYYRQLWEPPIVPEAISDAQREIRKAEQLGPRSDREQQFIAALALIYKDAGTVSYSIRAAKYEQAMARLAAQFKEDVEAQVFYALALLASASPSDRTHANQKKAADVLEPLALKLPEHPGIPHYLIHAYDNAELAARGLPYARAYSRVAPSAPHALHMPSHIFTRLGQWEDSIASNLAAQKAALEQGDIGEELHAMDYLVYAYLQMGREDEAAGVVRQLQAMPNLNSNDFKVAYASTAMPVRYAVERGRWDDAAKLADPSAGPPQVIAIAVWARGMGLARSGHASAAQAEIERLRRIEQDLRASGTGYWATQVELLTGEVRAWCAQAEGKPQVANELLRAAADEEDAVEKLPVTPGPILPAREQLGELLIEQGSPKQAAGEFEIALNNAPGRRGALQGAARAIKLKGERASTPQ